MKILVIFIDMIRSNRLSTFNNSINIDNPMDAALKELGGTFYTNCFSPGPDTPRSLSSLYTGAKPWDNGCNTRVKWPRHFIDNKLPTIFEPLIDNSYKLTFFSNPNERRTGMFPQYITDMPIHNEDFNLQKYLNEVKLDDDHFVFLSIPDFHWALGDRGYSLNSEKNAYNETRKVWDIIFSKFDKDEFDHTIVFSDHGFKFRHQIKKEPKYCLLNEDRSKIMMIHRKKGQSGIMPDNKLCSIEDVYSGLKNIIENNSDANIFDAVKRRHVTCEDHLTFTPEINQNLGIWSVVEDDSIYIRMLDEAYLIDRSNQQVKKGIIEALDNILLKETTYGRYHKEHFCMNEYNNFIQKQTAYMHGGSRVISKYVKFKDKVSLLLDMLRAV